MKTLAHCVADHRWFALVIVIASGSGYCSANDEEPASLPNVVLIVTDDAGYADFGFQDSPVIRTPHIDSIAAGGVRFTNAYVTASVCSPSRAGLLTGRYQQRFGHEFNLLYEQHAHDGLPTSETTLADALRERGYRTAAIGKWHLGYDNKYYPNQRGFEHFHGFLEGWRSYWPHETSGPRHMSENGSAIAEEFEYVTEDLGEAAARYIEENRDRCFFLYLAFNAPHSPMHAKADVLESVAGIDDPNRRVLAAMTRSLDQAVGRVLKKLADCGLEDETLVLLINDNGGATDNFSDNAPLRDHKGTPFEGGIRVPFLIRWPNVVQAGSVYEYPTSTLDVFPTVLAASGAQSDHTEKLDGVDLRPYLTGDRTDRPHKTLCWRRGPKWAIRHGDWKLVRSSPKPPMLFDLRRDIGETIDLAIEYPAVVKDLLARYSAWESEMDAPRWQLQWPPLK